jgi:uncharacterized protein
MKKIKSCTLSVSGTHCHACEILIEKEIKALPGVKDVVASTSSATVKITATKIPEISKLNEIFKESGYSFSKLPITDYSLQITKPNIFTSLLIVSAILAAFFLLQKIGLFSSFNVNTDSFYPAFFVFGLLAGFSTCAALVGGIILSLSRQWQSLYSQNDSVFTRLQPTIIFNLGRLVFFTIFGAILGYFGSFFRLSLTAGAIVTIVVSIIMLILALQMLGVKWAGFFNFSLPKSFTSNIANEKKFSGRLMPFFMGGLTFFLPCGFTLTSQSLALASGSLVGGGLIMFFFALGTFIPLLLIGYSSVSTAKNPKTSAYFSQVAGILVLLFALFNISNQFTVLGFGFPSNAPADQSTSAQTVDGVQVLKMIASSSGYTPNTFTVKAGQKVRWEITDQGASGCTNAVISRSLFDGPINLVQGTTSVKEFTAPTTPGTYRFSCWMGMISGTIEVVN